MYYQGTVAMDIQYCVEQGLAHTVHSVDAVNLSGNNNGNQHLVDKIP